MIMFEMPKGGLEPPCPFEHNALNVACLPISPFRQVGCGLSTSGLTGWTRIILLYSLRPVKGICGLFVSFFVKRPLSCSIAHRQNML